MTTVGLFRKPLARLHSHYRHVMSSVTGFQREQRRAAPLFAPERIYLRTKQHGPASDGLQREPALPAFNVSYIAPKLLQTISDNYYTRSLAGRSAWRTPFGELNATHLAAAQRVLRSLDWVLVLESRSTPLILERGLGLGDGVLPHERHTTKDTADFASSDVQYLSQLNRFDIELYDEAVRLNMLDLKSLEALKLHAPEAFAQVRGGGKGPRCCGYTCQGHLTSHPLGQQFACSLAPSLIDEWRSAKLVEAEYCSPPLPPLPLPPLAVPGG
eukprot:5762229-Prymnesium_polylepis.1